MTTLYLHRIMVIGSPSLPAPQATLMATIIKGLLSQNLPWGLVLVGVFISVTLELCGIRSLSFAVGSYLQSSDIARFYPEQRTPEHVQGRASEGFNKTYGIVHPGEQWESNRRVRMSPFYEQEQKLGAVFYEAAAWERPHWYESNAGLVPRSTASGRARARVGRALVVADHQRRASRDARPRSDVRPDGVLDLRRRR